MSQPLDVGVQPRANPPIVIGPFTNVPAPGSPIRSDWCQQITQYVVDKLAHRFYAERLTDAGPVVAPTPIGGLALTFTLSTTRVVELEAEGLIVKPGGNTGTCRLSIYLNGVATVMAMQYHAVNGYSSYRVSRGLTLAAGTYTAEVYVSADVDSATLAAGTAPAWLRVTDNAP